MWSLKEADITASLDYIQEKVSQELLTYCSVAEALEEIKTGTDLAERRRKNYEEYAAEQQKRIDELEEIIHEIYREWKEK